ASGAAPALFGVAVCAVERIKAEELCGASKLFFDAKQLVVLCDSIGAARRSGFYLSGVCGDRQIRDESVFGLTRSMRDDGCESVGLCHLDRIKSFGERADLIHLDQDRIRNAFANAALEVLGVCDKDIVSDELNSFSEFRGHRGPTLPIRL